MIRTRPDPPRRDDAPIVVLKFGSSVLRDEADLPIAVNEIYQHVRRGRRVVAVVSAMGRTTDRLLARARGYDPADGAPTAVATLLATGETTSAALLELALSRAGIPAAACCPHRLALRARGPALDAEPHAFDIAATSRRLAATGVLVVPGFVGLGDDQQLALLGRGGSDLTALFLAQRLGAARCILIKDVDGLYESDPARPGPRPRRFTHATFVDAISIGGRVVQPKAVHFAARHGVQFEVQAAGRGHATQVGTDRSLLAARDPGPAPLRVGLLGLGTVGGGVWELLRGGDERFEVVAIAVRDRSRRRTVRVPRHLLTDRPSELLDARCDVIVEATAGARPALGVAVAALRCGVHVVTTNKVLLARHRQALETAAAAGAARLLGSATVGGAVPVLERLTA
ncbi:MAG: amino acid kinase family protein, partial [Planctomycetota bacterium]